MKNHLFHSQKRLPFFCKLFKQVTFPMLVSISLFCLSCHRPPQQTKMEDQENPNVPPFTLTQAQNALKEMMKESDVYDWGGRRKSPSFDERLEMYENSDMVFPVHYIDDPIDVPSEMDRIEKLLNGKTKIGFWECDLENLTFMGSFGNAHAYTRYDGEFYKDEAGNWKARYWAGAHGDMMW